MPMGKEINSTAAKIFPWILIAYEMANYLSNDAYLPAMPQLAEDLRIDDHIAQLTLTAFFLGNATMQLILGPIADRYGRRFLMISSSIIFTLSTFYCGISDNISLFLVARFLEGAAVTAMIISGYSTIHAMYEQTQAIKLLSWMASITVLAPALGPLLGALILYLASWRAIFYILAFWAMCALIALYRLMPETLEKPIPIHPKSILKNYARVLCDTQFLRPATALAMLFGAMVAWVAAGPFLVMDTFKHSPFVFGIIQGFIFLSFIIGTRIVNQKIEAIGTKPLIKYSVTLSLLGALLSLILSYSFTDQLIDILLPMLLIGSGAGIGFPIFNRLAVEGSEHGMGIKMAMLSSFIGIGGLLGSGVMSSFFAGSLIQFSWILFAFTIVAWLIYLKK